MKILSAARVSTNSSESQKCFAACLIRPSMRLPTKFTCLPLDRTCLADDLKIHSCRDLLEGNWSLAALALAWVLASILEKAVGTVYFAPPAPEGTARFLATTARSDQYVSSSHPLCHPYPHLWPQRKSHPVS
jgi:hypothetical protein